MCSCVREGDISSYGISSGIIECSHPWKQHRQAGRERKSKLFYEEVREFSYCHYDQGEAANGDDDERYHIKFSLAEQALSESLQMNCLCKTKWKIR